MRSYEYESCTFDYNPILLKIVLIILWLRIP